MTGETSALVVKAASNTRPLDTNLESQARALYAQLAHGSMDSLQEQLAESARAMLLPPLLAATPVELALSGLTQAQREALSLHLSGKNHRQIALQQNRSIDETVRDLARAYVGVRTALSSQQAPQPSQASS